MRVSLFIQPFYRSTFVCVFFYLFHFTLLYTSFTLLVSPYLYQPSSFFFSFLFLFFSLFLSLSFSSLSFFMLFIYISLSTSTRSGKVANVGRTSLVSWVACQTLLGDFLFPREYAHATWRHGVSQAVLFCHIVGDYLADAF